jgi:Na+-translocating ferredoxin:NAD+ oxidoreductase RnfD subunit
MSHFPRSLDDRLADPVLTGAAGGFARWQQDLVASATPLPNLGDRRSRCINIGYGNLCFSGQIAGSLGETSALLIIFAAVYLILTRTALEADGLSTLVSAGTPHSQYSPVIWPAPSTRTRCSLCSAAGLLYARPVFMVDRSGLSSDTRQGKKSSMAFRSARLRL